MTDDANTPPPPPPPEAGQSAPGPAAGKWQKPQGQSDEDRVRDQVQRQAGLGGVEGGGGTLFTEPVLVVNQKAKIIELTNEYQVFDQNGTPLGSVCEIGQSTLKKALRFVSSVDQFMTHSYEIRNAEGNAVLVLVRPRKLMKSKFTLQRPDGSDVGAIVQDNVFGKIHFSFEAGGQKVGSMNAENWRAWNFNVQDASGTEVARITKTWEGLAKTMFTTADNYVLQVHRKLDDPLCSLVVATALCIDTALKQDSRGFN